MKTNFKFALFILSCGVISSSLFAQNGVCFHCEEIREYNRTHPQTYEYYEDYLNEQDKDHKESKPSGEQKVSKCLL